jgi:phosphatidylglycerophosphatase A
MCFTPTISLTTAIIEVVLATIILVHFKKSKFGKYFAIFVYLLGLYQFSEYMLCTSGEIMLWGKIAFITYTFLPPIALHATLKYCKKKPRKDLLYFLPIIFSVVALTSDKFILNGSCDKYIITLQTLFSQPPALLLYTTYYAIFILIACGVAWQAYLHTKNHLQKRIYSLEIVGVLLMTVPAFIFIIIFPALEIKFPSVLCQFAIFLAIAIFIGAYLDEKLQRESKPKHKKLSIKKKERKKIEENK